MHTTPEFALTRADYRLLAKAAARRLRRTAKFSFVDALLKVSAWCLLSAGLFLYFRLQDRFADEAGTLDLAAALVIAAALVTFAAFYLRQIRLRGRLAADGGAFLRRHSLAFDDVAMRMTWATGHAQIQWSNVIGKEADDANCYLFVDTAAAYVVPRHAVAAFQADFDRWLARLPA